MLLRRSQRGDELVVNEIDEMPIGLKILNVFKLTRRL